MRIKFWHLRKRIWLKIHNYVSKKVFIDYLICPYEDSTKKPFDFDEGEI